MEGPSLHILADQLAIFTKSLVIDAYGNAAFDKTVLIHQEITELYAYGKRLIIQLDSHALIIHFLMYGSYRIDEQRKGMNPRLALITDSYALFLYNCSVKCVTKSDIKPYLDFEVDILSPAWNIKKIIKTIKKHPQETIDDVLLDQNIFAGVGNIIKNEILFLSNIKPDRKIKDLSVKQLTTLALNARQFSHNFYTWRKNFELKQHLLVYRKKVCPYCGSPILRKKTGKRNRWTFFCASCQK